MFFGLYTGHLRLEAESSNYPIKRHTSNFFEDPCTLCDAPPSVLGGQNYCLRIDSDLGVSRLNLEIYHTFI